MRRRGRPTVTGRRSRPTVVRRRRPGHPQDGCRPDQEAQQSRRPGRPAAAAMTRRSRPTVAGNGNQSEHRRRANKTVCRDRPAAAAMTRRSRPTVAGRHGHRTRPPRLRLFRRALGMRTWSPLRSSMPDPCSGTLSGRPNATGRPGLAKAATLPEPGRRRPIRSTEPFGPDLAAGPSGSRPGDVRCPGEVRGTTVLRTQLLSLSFEKAAT
jgi:hypothetical protein